MSCFFLIPSAREIKGLNQIGFPNRFNNLDLLRFGITSSMSKPSFIIWKTTDNTGSSPIVSINCQKSWVPPQIRRWRLRINFLPQLWNHAPTLRSDHQCWAHSRWLKYTRHQRERQAICQRLHRIHTEQIGRACIHSLQQRFPPCVRLKGPGAVPSVGAHGNGHRKPELWLWRVWKDGRV